MPRRILSLCHLAGQILTNSSILFSLTPRTCRSAWAFDRTLGASGAINAVVAFNILTVCTLIPPTIPNT